MMSWRKRRIRRAAKPLTPIEKTIWKQVVSGKTSREIAKKLSLNFRTVADYRDILRAKLGVRSTAELVGRWYMGPREVKKKQSTR